MTNNRIVSGVLLLLLFFFSTRRVRKGANARLMNDCFPADRVFSTFYNRISRSSLYAHSCLCVCVCTRAIGTHIYIYVYVYYCWKTSFFFFFFCYVVHLSSSAYTFFSGFPAFRKCAFPVPDIARLFIYFFFFPPREKKVFSDCCPHTRGRKKPALKSVRGNGAGNNVFPTAKQQ